MNDGELDDAAFMHALEHGTSAPLGLYRRAYATAGVPWPGDDEVRRRHLVTDDTEVTPADRRLGLRWRDAVDACSAPWPSLLAAVDQCRWLRHQGWTVRLASVVAPGEHRLMPDGSRLLAEVYDQVLGTPGSVTYLDATDG